MIFAGEVVSIYIAPDPEADIQTTTEVRAIAGQGLEGDRYSDPAKLLPRKRGKIRHLSLIEIEVLDAVLRESGLELSPDETRRNILTRGVPLNHLVGQTFLVGEVLLRGTELCEPCVTLEVLTGKKLIKPLLHRGGLRAEILKSGTIAVGDRIVPAPQAP